MPVILYKLLAQEILVLFAILLKSKFKEKPKLIEVLL